MNRTGVAATLAKRQQRRRDVANPSLQGYRTAADIHHMSTATSVIDRLGPISPELALVDPQLRRLLVRMTHEEVQRPAWATARKEHQRPTAEEPAEGVGRGGAAGRLRLRAGRGVQGLKIIVPVSVVTFLLGAKFATPTPVGAPAKPSSGTSGSMTPMSAPLTAIGPGVKELAWAPAPGASGYKIAIYQGSHAVLSARTTAPDLVLTRSEEAAIPRGPLRWYVWPIGPMGRAEPPLVQSRLLLER